MQDMNLTERNKRCEERKYYHKNETTGYIKMEKGSRTKIYTLYIFRMCKSDIEDESWIDNTEVLRLIMRARTNTLGVNWRNSYWGKRERCLHDDCDKETLQHFLAECKSYESIANKSNLQLITLSRL